VDDYDFDAKKNRTVATRFRPPQRPTRSLPRDYSRKGQRLGPPLSESFHYAKRATSCVHAHPGKKSKTHPATARDLRFVGPAAVGNRCASQPTKPAHRRLSIPVPAKTQTSI